ncbi:MAG: hybrid sensor histidine kinase/response regulator [Longimicrobiales bacterium]
MEKPIRILILEDLPEDAEIAERVLLREGLSFKSMRVDTGETFVRALQDFAPDVVLCDYCLPGLNGLEALALAKETAPQVPVIIFTGAVSEETAVACLKAGAVDYVLKDRLSRLPAAVEAALAGRKERQARASAEEALRDSEHRYRTLVDNAPEAIVTVDSAARVRSWNAAAESAFGYSGLEMIGAPLSKIIPERFRLDHQRAVDLTTASVGTAIHPTLTVTAVRSDGLEFPAEISISSVHGPGDISFTAVIRDLTDSVAARDALEELSRRHELLLNSAGEGIVGVDPDGTVSFANPAALALLGREAADFVGFALQPLIHAPSGGVGHPEAECPALSALRQGSTFSGEMDFLRSDGSSFPAAVSLTPILESGVVGGGVMIFEDITRRRVQEEALRASEAQYRGLVDNAPYGIYRSGGAGRFLSVNTKLMQMLRYESEHELLALDLSKDLYLNPEERERFLRQANSDRGFGAETTWVRRDGTPVPVRLRGRTVRTSNGVFEAYEMFVEDLSERRLLEEQLRQAQKMEAVGQLTGGIAHDFNNVLAVILLNSELVIGAMEKGKAVDLDDIHAIQDAARRASSITRKLLGFSRRAALQVEATDLGRVVSGMSSMLRTALPESIELQVDTSGTCGPVMVDGGSVEQMLLNLVANSRDALPRGGRVGVKVHEVELDQAYCLLHPEVRPGRHMCLEVSDDGVGMDAETLRRIFDPFFTTKAPGSGTGLGMPMVYGLTRQQDGHINVYSHPGEGTTVRLYFPVTVGGEPATRGLAESPEAVAATGTILVVEDEDSLRAVTAKVLETSGYRVLSAADAAEALDIVSEHYESIDLILSDMVLPGMSGLALLDVVRSLHGPVRFVLTSGYSGEFKSVGGGSGHDVPFLRKPWTASELLALIRRVMTDVPPPVQDPVTLSP